jgi:hypothetical protein
MAIQHIYSGKPEAVTLPSSDRITSSLEGMNSIIRDADSIVYKAFRDNEKWFTDAMDVDVESYLSSANAQAQQDLLDKYNGEATNILKSVKGDFSRLSGEQKMALQRGKTALMAKQKKMTADMERYLLEKKIVESKPTEYDVEEWNNTTAKEYLSKGVMPETSIPYRRLPIGSWLNTNKVSGVGGSSKAVPTPGNPNWMQDVETSADVFDVAPIIQGKTLSDPRVLRDAQEAFKELPDAEKANYLNGTNLAPYWSDPRLKEVTSPVLRNYIDKNWQTGVKTTTGASKFKERSAGSGFNWNTGVDFNNNRNTQFAKNNDIKLQNLSTYPIFYDLQLGAVPSVIQKIQSYTDANTGKTKTLNKAVNIKIVGYSPNGDKLIVNVEDDVYPEKGESKENLLLKDTKIELDASLYDALLKSKPYGFSREKALKDMGVGVDSVLKPTVPNSGVKWVQ